MEILNLFSINLLIYSSIFWFTAIFHFGTGEIWGNFKAFSQRNPNTKGAQIAIIYSESQGTNYIFVINEKNTKM